MLVITSHITEQGKLPIDVSNKMRDWFGRNAGKNVIFTAIDVGERRSIKQMRYWFGVLYEAIYRQILRDLGYSRQEAKDLCYYKALGSKMVPLKDLDGTEVLKEKVRSLSDADVDTLEMIIAIWTLQNWAISVGVVLDDVLIHTEEAEKAMSEIELINAQKLEEPTELDDHIEVKE